MKESKVDLEFKVEQLEQDKRRLEQTIIELGDALSKQTKVIKNQNNLILELTLK